VTDFAADTGGATAMEYALIGTLISIVIVSALTSMGTTLSGFFTTVSSTLR
jgi:pilus assembly protein Flp/PilA